MGLGWAGWVAGLGGWPGGWAWATLKRKLVYMFENEAEIGLFENGKVCLPRKK